jgi:hypothetical protein
MPQLMHPVRNRLSARPRRRRPASRTTKPISGGKEEMPVTR